MEAWQRWIIAPVLKTDESEMAPWVRIPPLPPILGFFQQSKTFTVYEKKAKPVVYVALDFW